MTPNAPWPSPLVDMPGVVPEEPAAPTDCAAAPEVAAAPEAGLPANAASPAAPTIGSPCVLFLLEHALAASAAITIAPHRARSP